MRASRADHGKVTVFSLVVIAAIGFAVWKWGLPWITDMMDKGKARPSTTATPEKRQPTAQPAPAPAATAPGPGLPSGPGAPSAATPTATNSKTDGGTQPPPQPPVDPREAAAHKLLNDAKSWEANGRVDTAKAMYEELIQVYPGTKAAEDAKPLLAALKAK